jgi:hypothetical protein
VFSFANKVKARQANTHFKKMCHSIQVAVVESETVVRILDHCGTGRLTIVFGVR